MGFGDFLKDAVSAGASAFGVDSDDVGGFFDKAEAVLGGDGDAGDLFSAAAEQFGGGGGDVGSFFEKAQGLLGGEGDAGDLIGSAAQQFGIDAGEVTSAVGQGSGGFGGIVGNLLGGGGDIGGAAGQAIGGFGALFGGGGGAGGIVKSVSDFLPPSVTNAFSEAADLPFVQDAANANWADMASSVPGLDGALGSFGLSTKDVAQHIEGTAAQAIGGGSAWSFGSMLADQGSAFLGQVAAPVDADGVWASLPGLAQQAGVDLPGWATDLNANDLVQQGGHFLDDGGFVPTQAMHAADLYAVDGTAGDDTIGESQVAMADPALVADADPTASSHAADEFVARDEFASDTDSDPVDHLTAAVPAEVEPAVDEVPAPPDQFASVDDLEGGLEGLGDDVFG